MINMIFGQYVRSIEPREFLGDFYIYYTNRPCKHITQTGRLTQRELYFISDAIRHNRTVETYSGVIYQCVDIQAQFDPAVRRHEYYIRRFAGYHHKKKRVSHGKKERVTVTG